MIIFILIIAILALMFKKKRFYFYWSVFACVTKILSGMLKNDHTLNITRLFYKKHLRKWASKTTKPWKC